MLNQGMKEFRRHYLPKSLCRIRELLDGKDQYPIGPGPIWQTLFFVANTTYKFGCIMNFNVLAIAIILLSFCESQEDFHNRQNTDIRNTPRKM